MNKNIVIALILLLFITIIYMLRRVSYMETTDKTCPRGTYAYECAGPRWIPRQVAYLYKNSDDRSYFINSDAKSYMNINEEIDPRENQYSFLMSSNKRFMLSIWPTYAPGSGTELYTTTSGNGSIALMESARYGIVYIDRQNTPSWWAEPPPTFMFSDYLWPANARRVNGRLNQFPIDFKFVFNASSISIVGQDGNVLWSKVFDFPANYKPINPRLILSDDAKLIYRDEETDIIIEEWPSPPGPYAAPPPPEMQYLQLTDQPQETYHSPDPIYNYPSKVVSIGADCWPVNRNYTNPFHNPTPSDVSELCTVPTTCPNHPRPKMVKMLSTNVAAPPQPGTMAPLNLPQLQNGTADQCIDACNQMQSCGGFTRPVGKDDNDSEATCTFVSALSATPWFTTNAPPQLYMESIKPDASTNLWRKQPHAYPRDGIGEPWQRINPLLTSGGPRGCGKYLPPPQGYIAIRKQNIGGGTTAMVIGGNSFGTGTVDDCASICNGDPNCVGFRRPNSRDDDEVTTCVWASGKPSNVASDGTDMFYKISASS